MSAMFMPTWISSAASKRASSKGSSSALATSKRVASPSPTISLSARAVSTSSSVRSMPVTVAPLRRTT